MSDDRAGLMVAERLDMLVPIDVSVSATESPGTDLPQLSCGVVDAMILVDATPADADHPPGSVERLEFGDERFRLVRREEVDSHSLDVESGLGLARSLGALPSRVILYTIRGERFARGLKPTPAVERGVDRAVDMIRSEVDRIRGETPCMSSAS